MSGAASSSSIPVTTTMSTFLDSLPSDENVMNWKRKEVVEFLQENKEVLDIEHSNINVIEDNRVLPWLDRTKACQSSLLSWPE
jgi:hypothetical protein